MNNIHGTPNSGHGGSDWDKIVTDEWAAGLATGLVIGLGIALVIGFVVLVLC